MVTLLGEFDEDVAALLADILIWLNREGRHLITVRLCDRSAHSR